MRRKHDKPLRDGTSFGTWNRGLNDHRENWPTSSFQKSKSRCILRLYGGYLLSIGKAWPRTGEA